MGKYITIHELTSLDKRIYRCGIEILDFEKDFINNLLNTANYYTKGIRIYGDIVDGCNRDIKLYLSEKQINTFEKIRIRYKNAYANRCTYYIYSQIIEDYDIKLEKFDRDTLKSFKGEKESEDSKEWIRQIMLYK